ncbi:MAG TPA: cell division protein FtsW [Thermopetrobacter sp.]|nr:cell division protein FtsW [Thermopetrobacter sp.]
MISRKDNGPLARWWYTVDWPLMGAVWLLMALGVMFSLVASPPVAQRIGLGGFHFFTRHLLFLLPAAALFAASSMLNGPLTRRLALLLFIGGLGLMGLALIAGPEIKGAHRWIDLGPFNLQPSELAKPGFVVLAAWLLVEAKRRPEMPGMWIGWGLFGLFAGLLVLQPDMGQTVLVAATWLGLLFLSGLAWRHVLMLGGAALAGLAAAFVAFDHVRARIMHFIDPPPVIDGARTQMDFAREAFLNGGLFGAGPGGGSVNKYLPDAHTDFLLAAVAEEFGLMAVIVVIGVYVFIVQRILRRAAGLGNPFRRLAAAGLAILFGLQAFINLGVNVQLLPAKGMTLPLLSYGGSSLMAAAMTLGMALALLREDAREAAFPDAGRAMAARA